MLDGISTLLSKSLLSQDESLDREPRFGMLETIREFGLEQLAASGEEEPIRRRHAEYCLALVNRAERALRRPEQGRWLDRLEAEYANLRVVVAWSLEHAEVETGLRIASGLWRFWMVRGRVPEARDWLARLLDRRAGVPPPLIAGALALAADLAEYQGDEGQSIALAEEGLALARDVGDTRGVARALFVLGNAKHHEERFDEAVAYFEGAHAGFRDLDDEAAVVYALVGLADVWRDKGEPGRAAALLDEALEMVRGIGDIWGTACVLRYLADVRRDGGDHLGSLPLDRESLVLHHGLDDRWGVVSALSGLASLAARWDQPERAARLLGVREAMRAALGLPPVWPQHRRWYDPLVAGVRAALGDDLFVASWAAGRALGLDEAVAEGLLVTGPLAEPAAPPSDPAHGTGLTPRELEVLRLIAAGRSNRVIAEELFISPRTVATHTTGIFAKLGVESRTSAVAAARDRGLV